MDGTNRLSLIKLERNQNQSGLFPLLTNLRPRTWDANEKREVGERKRAPKDSPALKATALVLTLIEPEGRRFQSSDVD